MPDRTFPILAALFVALIVNFIGVVHFYLPIRAAYPPTGPLLPPPLAFLIWVVLSVLFFDWVSRQMNAPLKAGMTIAISQILLVDIDYVLSGERSVAAGGASAVVLLGSWVIVALVYRSVAGRRPGSGETAARR